MTNVSTTSWVRRARTVSAVSSMCIVLAACSGTGTGAGNAGGDPVPAGASKQEYIDALSEMDPVALSIQSNQGPEYGFSVPIERYAEAVEDWSGGKITFDIVYAAAIAPVTESGRAMADGLLDMGVHSYGTSMESFPVSELVQETFLVQQELPVAETMESIAVAVEQSAEFDEIGAELVGQGIYPLLPLMPSGGASLLCTDAPATSLADLKGISAAPLGPLVGKEATALGMTSIDLQYPELYDAMQRGVTDCVFQSISGMLSAGLFEVGDYWTLGVPTASVPAAFGISLDTWEQLPLPAQQLLFDRLDTFIAAYVDELVVSWTAEGIAEAQQQRVQISTFEPEVLAEMQRYHDARLAEIAGQTVDGLEGKAVVDSRSQYSDKWRDIIAELGYVPDVSWEEFPAWLEANPIDTQPFADRLMQETARQRPGADQSSE